MPGRFDKFVHDENIKNFTKRIRVETDAVRVAMANTLLKQEMAHALPPHNKRELSETQS
jgi:hypothetical protein